MTHTKDTATPYDGIIPTGWLTAYGRTFSDIPFSGPMFAEIEALRSHTSSSDVLAEMKDAQLAPQFEARHKLLSKLIKATGLTQVLEVAAGLSTRGLELTADPAVTYVEVELPAMVADKRKIISHFSADNVLPKRPNLHLEAGSAVDRDSLLGAARHFDESQPIVVTNEGLLRYLSFDEKTRYAKNVMALLEKFGGVWITSDISLPKIFYKEDDVMKLRRKRISEITGVNVADNLFKDEADAKRFFNELGFEVESHSLLEVTAELVSPGKLGMASDYVEAINGSAVCFVMSLK